MTSEPEAPQLDSDVLPEQPDGVVVFAHLFLQLAFGIL